MMTLKIQIIRITMKKKIKRNVVYVKAKMEAFEFDNINEAEDLFVNFQQFMKNQPNFLFNDGLPIGDDSNLQIGHIKVGSLKIYIDNQQG